MKAQRKTQIVIVVGRNRRVYARAYKNMNFVPAFVQKCFIKEGLKAQSEGFVPEYDAMRHSCDPEFVEKNRLDETTIKIDIPYITIEEYKQALERGFAWEDDAERIGFYSDQHGNYSGLYENIAYGLRDF